MFIEALLTTDRTWKKSKCPSVEERIKKMCYIYVIEYYSTKKKKNNATCSNMNGPAATAAAKLLQSCPTLCSPIDGSQPGSPIPGILQARTQEWVAISFSNA